MIYEPCLKVDFEVAGRYLISVKTLCKKDFEGKEEKVVEALKKNGGGSCSVEHNKKSPSTVEYSVDKKGGYEREETGNRYLGSHVLLTSPILRGLGELDGMAGEGKKKVLFFHNMDPALRHVHFEDIVKWYFSRPNPVPLREDYWRPFGKITKEQDVDALLFMSNTEPFLVWPKDHVYSPRGSNKRLGLEIYCRENVFKEELQNIFHKTR